MLAKLRLLLAASVPVALAHCTLGGSLDDLRGIACDTELDCPITGLECQKPICDGDRCTFEYPVGEVLAKGGDCSLLSCDGSGELPKAEGNRDDVQNDANECTADQCTVDGTSEHPPEPAGKSCAEGVCDGAGACVECLEDGGPDQCMGTPGCESGCRCQAGECRPSHCGNMAKDGDESDEDCGGSCAGCAPGDDCGGDADCASRVCGGAPMVCQEPTCEDGVTNGVETGADCGGDESGCPPCPDGEGCVDHDDCTSGVCDPQICQAPTCADATKNGAETDVDCGGGPPCKQCGVGQACLVPADCVSQQCRNADAGLKLCGPG